MTTNMRACDTACDSNEDNACDSNGCDSDAACDTACDSPASARLCEGLFSKCDSMFDRRRGPVTMNFCSKDCDSNCDSNGCDSDCDTNGCDSSCGGKKAGGLLSGFLSGHANGNCANNGNGNGNRLAMHGFGSGNHQGGLGGHGAGGGLLNPGSHLARLHAHHGLGLLTGRHHPYGGEIPHTANPAGAYGMQGGNPAPTYAYPYYTTRGPRDFLSDGCGAAPIAPYNPRSPLCLPSIGW